MLKLKRSIDRHRGTLTDTLPFEVLPTFSNDQFFLGLVRGDDGGLSDGVRACLAKKPLASKPYDYRIRQGASKDILVSVAHPLNQVEMARLLSKNKLSILESTKSSKSSLRSPEKTLDIFVNKEANDSLEKDGTVLKLTDLFESDQIAISSFFAYSRFNLFSKFYQSDELKRLERRFRCMRVLDISKCFYHIYTHSISWAISGKDFSKSQKNVKSFGSSFDECMRNANFGETVGIIVGPEVSRIFAEIILQSIDRSLEDFCLENLNSRVTFRRYVDDYLVFFNAVDDADKFERKLSIKLESFKLNLNDSKRADMFRPFIGAISTYRTRISKIFLDLRRLRNEAPLDTERNLERYLSELSQAADRVRECIAEGGSPNEYVPGALAEFTRELNFLAKAPLDFERDARVPLSVMLVRVFRNVFHLIATDPRVSVLFKLAPVLDVADRISQQFKEANRAFFNEALALEYDALIDDIISEYGDLTRIEVQIALSIGRNPFKDRDCYRDRTEDLCESFISSGEFDYWSYVNIKYCGMKYRDLSWKQRQERLDIFALDFIAGKNLLSDCEGFLTASALINSPHLKPKNKKKLYSDLGAENYTVANRDQLAMALNFVDWQAPNLTHLLRRKPLRPAYG